MLAARRVVGMDRVGGRVQSELPQPGDLHLAAAPPMVPVASQTQWGTLASP